MEWVRGDVIGYGSFAAVNIAVPRNRAGAMIAVKSSESSNSAMLRREGEVMRTLGSCPHIIRCLGEGPSLENGEKLHNLFMEYASGGSLAGHVKNYPAGLPESQIRRFTRSVLMGIRHIHARGFVHCDIKLHNILLCNSSDGKYEAKIADFGLAKEAGRGNRSSPYELFGGTPMYMSPESIAGGECGAPADIWALGCAVVEMATGKPVWPYGDVTGLFFKIGVAREIPELPRAVSAEGRDFLNKCFERNTAERWTAKMLLDHPFVLRHRDDAVSFEKQYFDCETSISPRSHFELPECLSSRSSTFSNLPIPPPADFAARSPRDSSEQRREKIRQLAGETNAGWSSTESWVCIR